MAESSFGAMATGGEEYSFGALKPPGPRSPLSPTDGADQIDRTVKIPPNLESYTQPAQPFLRHLQENAPDVLGMLATLLIPGGLAARPIAGPLLRMGLGALTAGGTKLAQTQDLGEAGETTGRFALSQGVGESIFGAAGPLFNFLKERKLGEAALKQHQAAVADRAQKVAARKQQVAKQQAEYTQKVNAYHAQLAKVQEQERLQQAEHAGRTMKQKQASKEVTEALEARQGALAAADAEAKIGTIADYMKSRVPTFKDLPSTSEGAWQMAFGVPSFEVRKAFEEGLLRSLPKRGMRSVEIPVEDAVRLKLSPTGSGTSQLGSTVTMPVDARDAGMKILGWFKKDRGLYHRVIRALDEANVGDPANRAMYRASQAWRQFADKSQVFDANHVFHPEKAQAGLGKIKAGREVLGTRPEVELFQKLEAAKPLASPPPIPELRPFPPPSPLARPQPVPRPIPPPEIPEVPPSEVTKGGVNIGHGLGFLGGLAASYQLGLPHPYLGGIAGGILGRSLGPTIPTYQGVPRGSIGRVGRAVRRAGPTALGAAARATWDYILEDELTPGPSAGPLAPATKPSSESE